MYLIDWFILLLSAVVAFHAGRITWRMLHGERVRRLLAARHHLLCEVGGGVGLSILCVDPEDERQVVNLLDTEYPCFEAVVVIDGALRGELLHRLIADYRLFRVDYRPSTELPTEGVRGLYRSRNRCFRRLVVVDREHSRPVDDYNTAVGVAAFEYLLPVGAGQYLRPHAIERIAVEIGRREEPTQLLHLPIGSPAMVVAREKIIRSGGFGGPFTVKVPRQFKTTLYEPLIYRTGVCRSRGLWRRVTLPVMAGLTVAALLQGWWTIVALLLTILYFWAVVHTAAPFVSPPSETDGENRRTLHRKKRKFASRNFTIS